MGRSYGSKHVQLKPAKLTKPVLLAIGKLVRAMAEIEDMVDLFICKLAEISPTKATILLGKTAVTRRIEIAELLATVRADDALKFHKDAFDDAYFTLVDARNAVAHGTLLGKDETGMLFFQTSLAAKPQGANAMKLVCGYKPGDIIRNAEGAERLVSRIERLLKVEDMRATRHQQPLDPHPKAQPPRNAKPQRPPQPSQA